MRLGTRLFLAYLAIFALCLAAPVVELASRMRKAYVESAEEPLVDTANILAAFVGERMAQGPSLPVNGDRLLDTDQLSRVFQDVRARTLSAQLYEMRKDKVDLSIYVTDDHGMVVFDSDDPANVGKDFSQWHDVYHTLRGEYGARIRRDPDDPQGASALFVAAPILVGGNIAGVLTVTKPTTNIAAFVHAARPHVFKTGALALVIALLLALAVSFAVTQQVNRLTRYADDVRQGRRVPFPKLARTELQTMGRAFEKMREALAGHAYVEQYVQTLTHEIKSPISAIRGAAEILETPGLPDGQRAKFLANIQNETRRIQDLVDRMLKLTELEAQDALERRALTPLAPLVRTIIEAVEPVLLQKRLRVDLAADDAVVVHGDTFLLHLALSNLLQNAIEFSPPEGRIAVQATTAGGRVEVNIDDQGPGLPAFAAGRVFEKFFSLERPDTGKKSTGLGLNFVKEVAVLHGGAITLENLPGRGLRARLILPAR
ncbi:MAG: two-component system sensor histidine kinase CreC [Myxococcales bacterium]